MKKILIAASAALLLAGCSTGPGKGEVEEALGVFFQQAVGTTPAFEDLQVGECKAPSSGPGYACSVTGKATITMGSRSQTENLVGTFLFEEIDGEWKVMGRM